MSNNPDKPAAGNAPRADFSGVSVSADSTAEILPQADFSGVSVTVDSTAEIVGQKTHTVIKGETLSAIAKQHLGNANAWREIFEINRDILSDPDRIQPGQVLKIPLRQS